MDDGQTGFAIMPDSDVSFWPGFYKRSEFREYERRKWDDRYAPEGWDPRDDEPDVVLMRRER